MYPFERFAERAKTVLTLAQEEAERSRRSYVGTEHLLLALLRAQDGVAYAVLTELRVDIDSVRDSIEAMLARNERTIIAGIIPTSRVKKVIELSFEEARRLGSSYVDTEHMLLGLLLEGEGVAAHVLTDMGVTLDRVRTEIERLDPVPAGAPPLPVPPASTELTMLIRLARQVAAAEGAPRATIDHLRHVLFSKRVAVMLKLAEAIDALETGEEQERLKADLAKAEESFRLSLKPPEDRGQG